MKKVMRVFLVLMGVFMLASFIITGVVYNQSFPRFDRYDDTINASLRYQDIEPFYERDLITFDSGDNQLQGYVYYQEASHGLVIIAHGLGGGADSYLAYTKWFLDQGWSVFMFDATGSFDSEGKSTNGFPQSLVDLESGLNYITSNTQLNDLDILLFGHSWGGYAVANALHFDFDIKAVVTAAAPYEATAMVFEQSKKMMGVFAYTQYPFLYTYQRIKFKEYAMYNAIDAINQSNAHVMIIHGINDDTIDYRGSAIIAKRDDISNPNTIYKVLDKTGNDGHNNLFYSLEATMYMEELNVTYRTLYDAHNEAIPYEINQEFYNQVDRFLVQQLDEALMFEIHEMFLQALDN